MNGDEDQRLEELRGEIVDQVARLGVKLDAVAFEMRSRTEALSNEQATMRQKIVALEKSAITDDTLPKRLIDAGVITSASLGDVLWSSVRVTSMRALKTVITVGGAIGVIVAVVSWLLKLIFGGA